MTIHRALAELKLIDSKIEKAINSIEPTGVMQNEKLVNGFIKKEDFESNAKSKLQSVNDLIDRKNKIKSAIVTANGITKVKISDKEMTIADAINFKAVIIFKKNLLYSIRTKHQKVKSKFLVENDNLNKQALENAKIMLGKQDDSKVKPTDDDVKNIMDPFVKRNEFILVDPLEVDKLTESMQKEIDDFEIEVDASLSEINATTFIEI